MAFLSLTTNRKVPISFTHDIYHRLVILAFGEEIQHSEEPVRIIASFLLASILEKQFQPL